MGYAEGEEYDPTTKERIVYKIDLDVETYTKWAEWEIERQRRQHQFQNRIAFLGLILLLPLYLLALLISWLIDVTYSSSIRKHDLRKRVLMFKNTKYYVT